MWFWEMKRIRKEFWVKGTKQRRETKREKESKRERSRHPKQNHFFDCSDLFWTTFSLLFTSFRVCQRRIIISLQNYIIISLFIKRTAHHHCCATLINTRAPRSIISLSSFATTWTKEYQQEQHSKEYISHSLNHHRREKKILSLIFDRNPRK